MDDYTRKRLLAVEVLLEVPTEISDGLEAELYALRDKLHAEALIHSPSLHASPVQAATGRHRA
jgi:hypothetical protein